MAYVLLSILTDTVSDKTPCTSMYELTGEKSC